MKKKSLKQRGTRSIGVARKAKPVRTRKKMRTRKTATATTAAVRPLARPTGIAHSPQPEAPREVPHQRGTAVAVGPQVASGGGQLFVVSPLRRRMVVLPPRGLRAEDNTTANALISLYNARTRGFVALSEVFGGPGLAAGLGVGASTSQVAVVDSIAENGAKLIEIAPGDERAFRASLPSVRLVPEVFYEPLSLRMTLESALIATGVGATVKVKVRSVIGGAPIRDVKVIAFTDFANHFGAQAVTDATGTATLLFSSVPPTLERVYAFADAGFWGIVRPLVATAGGIRLDMMPIRLGEPDGLRHVFGQPPLTAGQGVRVGILDTGCGPHPNLAIAGGFNAVTGQNPSDFGDNGDRHGTHVAGIVAGRGSAPTGVRGVAPGVTLMSYRVFAKGANASNFDIAKAIDRAVDDKCDLLNLSLGRPASSPGGAGEPAVRAAIEDARSRGSVIVAAAGNDGRAGVSFPAFDDLCIAVSAFGHVPTIVPNSTSANTVAPPPGADPDEFIADFSNIGPQLDLTAPGVGIVSSVVPGGAFAVMDGTSMACPAATGAAARLLSSNAALLGMPRNADRSAAIIQFVLQHAETRGFTQDLEGRGLVK